MYTKAFEAAYSRKHVSEFGVNVLRWSKKLAFDDKYVLLNILFYRYAALYLFILSSPC